jgi:hypothetical protein
MTRDEKLFLMAASIDRKPIEVAVSDRGVERWIPVTGVNHHFKLNKAYRIAVPKPIQSKIDWAHVDPNFVAMATDQDGNTYLYPDVPEIGSFNSISWYSNGLFVLASAFVSFKPGNMDWRESLVLRPNRIG